MYVAHNTKKISLAYKSKHNSNCEEQVILLMIGNGEKWHYTAVTRLSGLLRGVTSNHNNDFYCLNCFHSYSAKNKLEEHKKIFGNHDYCHVKMPTKDNNIIKYNQGEKSIKLPFAVYSKNRAHVKITLMNRLLLKLINTYHLVIHYSLIVHLIKQKINLTIIEVKIV